MDLVEKEIVPMKKNLKSNIAQKGGLMIEALAMLGLIAVVTPTMYKKSAERALEVEDINTADTVRSYMGATEAYMAANYRNLIKQMTEKVEEDGTITPINVTTKQVSWGDIKSYMPYGFDNGSKDLYDYNYPKIAIWRDGTNLTAYALFPAKGTGGLGQERTSRIASLIGANGGYTKSDKSAHGVGGVWNLSEADVKKLFTPEGSQEPINYNEFSLVTSSSNVINSTSGAGAVENTKYLQRTAENTGEEWRNTMRTDLYMGGGDDNKINDPDSKDTGNHNIVNINSLIVGADKDIKDAKNGLYIAPSWTDEDGNEHNNNPNAYISGTLTALGEKFLVGKDDEEKGFVYFGDKGASKTDSNDNPQYPFRIAESGKVTTVGDINLANANQATADNVVANIGSYGATTDDIKINGTEASELTSPHLFHGEVDKDNDGNPYVSVSLLSEEMFKMTSDNEAIENDVDKVSGTHVMIEENGYRGADATRNKDEEDKDIDSLGNKISPNYATGQIFPVVIGSNAMVKGVMSAGQVDTQVLRTAALTTGSEHIDDEYKWLNVDSNGIVIREIDPEKTTTDGNGKISTTGMYGHIKSDSLEFKSGNDDNDARIRMQRNTIGTVKVGEDDIPVHGGDVDISGQHVKMVTNDSTNGTATVRNANMGMQIRNRDLTIGVKEKDSEILSANNSDISSYQYRVVIGRGGNVDMVGSNLKIMNNDDENILTVKGNSNAETTSKFGSGYNDLYSVTGKPDYNIVTHGNILFGSMNEKDATEIDSNNYANYAGAKFVAIGPDDNDAGVNIVEATKGVNETAKEVNDKRVLFVDLSKKDSKAHVNTNEAADYKLAVDDTSIGNSLEDHKMQAGTVYVRKGLVEVVPNPTDRQKDTNTGRSKIGANDGSGIIRASRFVANNINKDGKEEKVLDILNGVLDKYNGSGTVKYDTYMVNPAYTSVMKDIKLTTRGGARLSDILPDFISKGIYLASNTFDDTKQEMRFALKSDGSFNLSDENLVETPTSSTSGNDKYTANNWASPYSGLVPAPQCPPGYGRVITITPYRFEMAQAGQLALSADAGTGQEATSGDAGNAGYYVNTLDMASKLKRASYSGSNKEDLENELLAVQPAPRTLNVAWNNGSVKISSIEGKVTKKNESAAINIESGSGEMGIDKATGMEVYAEILQSSTDYDSQPEEEGYGHKDVAVPTTYVISSGVYSRGAGESTTATYPMSPLVFQQSTWLHTEAVPVVPSGDEPGTGNQKGTYVGYNPDGKYVRGWAVLQGFLYHYNEYKNFACSSGSCKELSPISDTDENEVLWNLFPVAKNSLGSYVTTYCYFDRLNQWGNFIPVDAEGSETSKLIEQFDVLNEIPTDYVKGRTTSAGTSAMELKRKTYYENLNDPTMKYNEVW